MAGSAVDAWLLFPRRKLAGYTRRVYTDGMSLQHSFLGLLERGPQHGYSLKQQYDDAFGGQRDLRFGQVYATLSRLEKASFAEVATVEAGDGPDRKTYVITPEGVSELETWLAATDPVDKMTPTNLHTRVIVSLLTGRPVEEILDAQRRVHIDQMRLLRSGSGDSTLERRLTIDFLIGQLNADLEWIELAGKRIADPAWPMSAEPKDGAR